MTYVELSLIITLSCKNIQGNSQKKSSIISLKYEVLDFKSIT